MPHKSRYDFLIFKFKQIVKNLSLILFALLLLSACEKVTDQQQFDEPHIVGLMPLDCDYCSDAVIDHSCCCILELVPPTASASIELCGTTTNPGSGSCTPTPPPGCEQNTGPVLDTTTINTVAPYEFCAAREATFRVTNTGTSSARVKITCFSGAISPPSVILALGSNDSRYIEVTADCVAVECM